MNASSATFSRDVSEPEALGLEMAPSVHVRPPRVKRSPVALECRYVKTIELSDADGRPVAAALILGEVVGIYIDDVLIENGRVNIARAVPIGRLGYYDYGVVDHTFELGKPDSPLVPG
jgi:flavin reductase (DIM6/NTAB) family NADH-FMN oxidoreductase RutF